MKEWLKPIGKIIGGTIIFTFLTVSTVLILSNLFNKMGGEPKHLVNCQNKIHKTE